ncbi:MAG: hypothetical protein V1746_06330 [bacterium]
MSTSESNSSEPNIKIFAQSPLQEGMPTVYLGVEVDENDKAAPKDFGLMYYGYKIKDKDRRLRVGIEGENGIIWCKGNALIKNSAVEYPPIVSVPRVNEAGVTEAIVIYESGFFIKIEVGNDEKPQCRLFSNRLMGVHFSNYSHPKIALPEGTIITCHSREDQFGENSHKVVVIEPTLERKQLCFIYETSPIDPLGHFNLQPNCEFRSYTVEGLKGGEWIVNLTAKKREEGGYEIVVETNTGKLFHAGLKGQGTGERKAEWSRIGSIPDGMPRNGLKNEENLEAVTLLTPEQRRMNEKLKELAGVQKKIEDTREGLTQLEKKIAEAQRKFDVPEKPVPAQPETSQPIHFTVDEKGVLHIRFKGKAGLNIKKWEGNITAASLSNGVLALGTEKGRFLAVKFDGDKPTIAQATLKKEGHPIPIRKISDVTFDEEGVEASINGQRLQVPYTSLKASDDSRAAGSEQVITTERVEKA